MADTQTVLRLDKVCKSYHAGTPLEVEVLHDIDPYLNRGDFVALIGPSGSGKSTLLNIVGLLDRPSKGRLVIDGHDTGTLDDAAITDLRGHSIGFVFQYHYLISAFTALENVMMPLLVDHVFPTDDMRQRAHQLLSEMGLAAWEDNLANNMSGGQQQRQNIFREAFNNAWVHTRGSNRRNASVLRSERLGCSESQPSQGGRYVGASIHCSPAATKPRKRRADTPKLNFAA